MLSIYSLLVAQQKGEPIMDLIKQMETEKRYHPIGGIKAPVELLPGGIEVPATITH